MIDDNCRIIKNDLESFFDIPFDVNYLDYMYQIYPHNEFDELFEVRIQFRQKVRIIVEIEPQKYAASMVSEINHADEEKRKYFRLFVEQMQRKHAKVEFFVNQQSCNLLTDESWSLEWKRLKIRATQIVSDSLTNEQEISLVQGWSKLSVGLILSLLTIESVDELKHAEGKITVVTQNKYERNPINRELCLSAHGYICKICGFNFEDKYGVIGREFIHVHHIEMVSSFGGEYYLDPVKDLIPVCPNCHAMLHKKTPPYLPEELRGMIKQQELNKGDIS